MAVNVKLGVDMSGFKQGISEANAQLKTFDAQLKFAETTFKKTGNAEAALATKTDALSNKLKVQKQVVQQYEKALEDMRAAGVDPASKSYQQMAAAMLNMQSAANETEIALNGLSVSQLNAATTADKMANSLNDIGGKMSLDQVISGIDKITGGLENATKKAIKLGESIWNNIMDSARLADETGTAAMLLDMDVEDYQRYKGVFDTIGEITVTEWMNAKRKIQKAINDPSSDQVDVLSALGIKTHETSPSKYGEVQTAARYWEDVFWEAASVLKEDVETGRISQDLADTYAEALFGKKATALKPLMALGREGFTAALDEQNVASAQAIENNGKLADAVTNLTNSYESLKQELTSGFSPALTDAANAMNGLLGKVIEYIQTDEGQEAVGRLSEAVSSLLGDISNIKPEDVVNSFVGVFESVTGSLQWVVDNKEAVVTAMKGIFVGWAGLKLTGGVLDVIKLVDGIRGLTGNAAAEGAAAGASWGTAFAGAVAKAAPWLIGLYTMLNPSTAQDNSFINSEGKLTQDGYYEFARQMMEDSEYKKFMMELGTYLGADQLRKMMGNPDAITDIWNYLASGQFGYNTLGFLNEVLGQYTGMSFSPDWLGVEFNEDELNSILQEMNLSITPTFIIPENAAEIISQAIGPVMVPVQLEVQELSDEEAAAYFGGNGHANGLPFVPYDGYLALLHKGERVLTASQNKSYTYYNHTYLDNVHLHNSMEIDALTDSIARSNQRRNAGYGA